MTTHDRGFIALISVIISGALALALAIGLSSRSIGEMQMSLGQQQSHRALALADLCAERALMKLASVLDYAGNETVTIAAGSCSIGPVSGTGNLNRVIEAQSAVSGFTRKVKVTVTRVSPVTQISAWNEVADF
ncbi:MAG: hypothetical protein AAB692_02410 [Patescibacteria group bacterium]